MFAVKKRSVVIITMIRTAAATIDSSFKGATLPKVINKMDIIEEATNGVERLIRYFLKSSPLKFVYTLAPSSS
jgi:hypothetical protein